MSSKSDSDLDERIEVLKQKYLQKTSEFADVCAVSSADEGAAGRSQRLRQRTDHHTALRQIYRTLYDCPQRPDSAEDQRTDEEEDFPEQTNIFCTETDVTLPSDLGRSCSPSGLSSRRRQEPDRAQSVSSGGAAAAVHVYQEMMNIYEKLQAERVSQQAWAAELCERERDLQHRENTLLQQQHSAHTRRGEEDELLRRVHTLQQQYQQETSQLEAALKQKTKEIKRMKASFHSMKDLNDSMRKQLHEVSEQNRKLEGQSRRVQARLENLQRKYESFNTHRVRETAAPKPCRAEKPQSDKAAAQPLRVSVKLLPSLLDWIVDTSLMENRDELNIRAAPPTSLQDRCTKVLPLLVEQLHHQAAVLEAPLLLAILRCIYCSLLHLERSTQHVLLTSTLRRLCDELCRGSGDGGRSRVCPLFKSSCLHTRFLSSLIIAKTSSQVDVLAQAVDVLSCAVRTDEGQMLFLEYQALPAVLALLRAGGPGLLAPSVDVLMQMSAESPLLPLFLDQCSTEGFFRCVSQVLRNPRLEPLMLEKMLMILQKLSSIRKNKRLFEASSLHLFLQEKHRTTDRSQAFISMNLSSILLNLGMLTRS
ncbi:coiled-coil domain-containing protein 138-like [Danio aesculapii]|uniref:coiled-coil domain-containing protein 138-like n=1 Tax=Danio aesculapii TaxID=1142201 RepID=UPI0024C0C294|nr:coiled-coil domain-containing protein 138-like [Danio aesculapii]